MPAPFPRLAPGLRVVRRGLHHVQVGLYDGQRALLPRTEKVDRALELLIDHQLAATDLVAAAETDPAIAAVLDHLERQRCLAWSGSGGTRVQGSVAVLGRLETPGLPDVDGLLRACGATPVSAQQGADVVIVLSAGELDRELLDPLIRRGTSHLVVRLVDGGALLGPFTVPGTSPCLRCVDAHLSGHDPDHVAVTTRYVRATQRARADGMPDLDPALAALAVAWAVRDVVAHLGGREPSTWSRIVSVGADPAPLQAQEWLRHPRCGCCWSADEGSSGTMEA